MGLILINRESEIPLIGNIAFGIIDRNTNLLQIRPTTICNLNCVFCSTDGGLFSKYHKTNFIIEESYLLQWIREIAKIKGNGLIAHIDSVGDPATYTELVKLVKDIKKIENFNEIAIQTNGTLLNENLIDELKNSGLSKVHLSIHSLDNKKAKILMGNKNYNVNKIIKIANYIVDKGIDLWINPVYLPNINDNEIIRIIKLVKELKCNIGLQKYIKHKHGRKMKIKQEKWYDFYNKLRELEKAYDIKLIHANTLRKTSSLPIMIKKNEKIKALVKSYGWFNNQMLAAVRNRCITVNNCKSNIDDLINIKVIENKHNIYLANMIDDKIVR